MYINTIYGKINNVPDTNWIELKPFWPTIAKNMIEVIHENTFRPYMATESSPDGIVSAPYYWLKYKENIPFSEAVKFLNLLKSRKDFTNVIRIFNKGYDDWIKIENLYLLGSRVYSFYYTLSPALSTFNDSNGIWLKVIFS